jgi:membrane fusion protein (multidrug efflux system)
MNPIVFAMRRPVTTLMLVVGLASSGVLGMWKMRVDYPPLNTTQIYAYLDYVAMRAKPIQAYIVGRVESYFHRHKEQPHEAHHKIVATSPQAMDVTITQRYVCQIHSKRHINVCALENGYIKEISVREGQAVKKDQSMFKIVPILYKAKLDAELAEALLAELEYNNTKKLFETKEAVSQNEVKLFEARLAKAQAKADLAKAELEFTNVKAPFDGIVDRQHEQLGSLVKEGDVLTTLSDNSVMWVYFNVPERDYLEYMAGLKLDEDKAAKVEDVIKAMNEGHRIELMVADVYKFPHSGEIGAIEGQFNNETGNIPFRADFPNPNGLLRHGQTGSVWIYQVLKDAIVIPQRATYEILDKRYVYVLDKDDVAHQRAIVIQQEMDDIFVIKKGLDLNDKIVLDGVRQVHTGEKVEFEFRSPQEALANQKFHAE